MSTGYALLCKGLAKPSILAIGVEAVLASVERFDDPALVTPQLGTLVIPTCMRLAMLDKLDEGHQGVVRGLPGLSLPSRGPNLVVRRWCAAARHAR